MFIGGIYRFNSGICRNFSFSGIYRVEIKFSPEIVSGTLARLVFEIIDQRNVRKVMCKRKVLKFRVLIRNLVVKKAANQ